MNKTLKDEILRVIHNGRTNFIGIVTTPWHIHGLLASINYLKATGIELFGQIIITPHVLTGYSIIPHDIPELDGFEVSVIDERNASPFYKLKKICYSLFYILRPVKKGCSGRLFYLVEPRIASSFIGGLICSTSSAATINHCIYDEGVSSYFPFKYKSSSFIESLNNLYLKHIVYGWGFRILNKKYSVCNLMLFLREGKDLLPNRVIIPYYISEIKKSNKNVGLDNNLFKPNSILICTTAWVRSEIVDDEDICLIKKIKEILIDLGYTIIFKPHPRDSIFKQLYGENQVITNNKVSLEAILLSVKVKPKAIISISSTTLVTSKLLADIPSYDISQMLAKDNIGSYVNEITSFHNVFGKYISSPQSIDELIHLIQSD